ncbi:hypothetical protein [Actinocorallia longicatena]|uniref:DUF222 domain-containing protein n=1 Tax=Actinocorallia longicatena TaxID=111803 RepID=A0ABP6QK70_9ACTN
MDDGGLRDAVPGLLEQARAAGSPRDVPDGWVIEQSLGVWHGRRTPVNRLTLDELEAGGVLGVSTAAGREELLDLIAGQIWTVAMHRAWRGREEADREASNPCANISGCPSRPSSATSMSGVPATCSRGSAAAAAGGRCSSGSSSTSAAS